MQALYNVLGVYFTGTPVAGSSQFFGGMNGTQRLNYLQVYYQDINYGIQNTTAETITLADGSTASETFQDLLNMVSDNLLEIAETEP